jgi:DNA repair protein RadA/Sms
MKEKTVFVCQSCAAQFPKWTGQCQECGAWNSIIEENFKKSARGEYQKTFVASHQQSQLLAEVKIHDLPRIKTNIEELDRVLGGGIVSDSVILVGGDPGIGKSTLLLQTLANISKNHPVLYVTGEESMQQIALRAKRLDLAVDNLYLLPETQMEKILAEIEKKAPKVIVIDSIQTMATEMISSASGSVSQVRESAALLVRYAKNTNTALFLVGHVTKEGTLAGPRVLEHMVDSVLYFEGESDSRYRVIRATKNRFGAVNELGIFAMTERGLREVSNPSAIFLSHFAKNTPGSAITVIWEGSRPLLIEVQALVDDTHLANPRRVTVGLDLQRLAMLLAVLHRHGGIPTYNQDVFANVVGGIKVNETSPDLAVLLATLSSIKNKPLPEGLIVFGEVGLGGEIRPVQNGQERIKEAIKHGFKKAIIPLANAPKKNPLEMEIIPVKTLIEALRSVIL